MTDTTSSDTDGDLASIAKERWNRSADEFNQWSELGGDEKAELIAAVRAEACCHSVKQPASTA